MPRKFGQKPARCIPETLARMRSCRHIDSVQTNESVIPLSDPYLPCDAVARALAVSLLRQACHAALAVTDHTTQTPNISRIALGLTTDCAILTLISTLSAHASALLHHPDCAVLVGEPGPKGDPLTHPRLMIQARATILHRQDARHDDLRRQWLHLHPKAKLYVDFADFRFVQIDPVAAVLNAGFGRAYRLAPADLVA